MTPRELHDKYSDPAVQAALDRIESSGAECHCCGGGAQVEVVEIPFCEECAAAVTAEGLSASDRLKRLLGQVRKVRQTQEPEARKP